jgi:hypothetical protein
MEQLRDFVAILWEELLKCGASALHLRTGERPRFQMGATILLPVSLELLADAGCLGKADHGKLEHDEMVAIIKSITPDQYHGELHLEERLAPNAQVQFDVLFGDHTMFAILISRKDNKLAMSTCVIAPQIQKWHR